MLYRNNTFLSHSLAFHLNCILLVQEYCPNSIRTNFPNNHQNSRDPETSHHQWMVFVLLGAMHCAHFPLLIAFLLLACILSMVINQGCYTSIKSFQFAIEQVQTNGGASLRNVLTVTVARLGKVCYSKFVHAQVVPENSEYTIGSVISNVTKEHLMLCSRGVPYSRTIKARIL